MTTHTTHRPPVAVGIDGSEASAAALRWAAAEAERAGTELLLAHAADLDTSGPLTGMANAMAHEQLMSYGHELMAAAVADLAEDMPHLVVRSRLAIARPAELLHEVSRTAALLVIGRSPAGRLVRFMLGAVSHRVAAHSLCPVVVVGTDAPPRIAKVAVGISTSAGGLAAMRLACTLAIEHGATLTASAPGPRRRTPPPTSPISTSTNGAPARRPSWRTGWLRLNWSSRG